MKAELCTKCGCRRVIDVTFPPPPDIIIPLDSSEEQRGWLGLNPEAPTAEGETRLFRRGLKQSKQQTIVFYYEV